MNKIKDWLYNIKDWIVDGWYQLKDLNWRETPHRLKMFYFNNGIFGISSFVATIMAFLMMGSGIVVVYNQHIQYEVNQHNNKYRNNTYKAVNAYAGKSVKYLAFYTGKSQKTIRDYLAIQGISVSDLDRKTKKAQNDQQFWNILNPIGDKYLNSLHKQKMNQAKAETKINFIDSTDPKQQMTDSDWKKPILFILLDPNDSDAVSTAKKWIDASKSGKFEVRVYNKALKQSSQGFLEGLYKDIVPGDEGSLVKDGYGNDYNNVPTMSSSAYFLKDGNLYGAIYSNVTDLPSDLKFPTNSLQKK